MSIKKHKTIFLCEMFGLKFQQFWISNWISKKWTLHKWDFVMIYHWQKDGPSIWYIRVNNPPLTFEKYVHFKRLWKTRWNKSINNQLIELSVYLRVCVLFQRGQHADSSSSFPGLSAEDVRAAGVPLLPRAVWHQTGWLPGERAKSLRFSSAQPGSAWRETLLLKAAPSAFQYSICNEPLIELSNPGASSSWFYLTSDDEFIIKTVQHKEAEFLQKLLPGYYMVSKLCSKSTLRIKGVVRCTTFRCISFFTRASWIPFVS